MGEDSAKGRTAATAKQGRHALVLTLLVLGGLAIRVWVLGSPLGVIDSDEAVGALIARHLLEGDPVVFLWGNHYGGTLEAFPTAALFAVFGSGTVVAKSVMVMLYGVGAVLVWRVGRRLAGETVGRLAAVLFWVFPASMVLISTKARLYYGSGLVIGLCVLLLCLRLAHDPRRLDVACLGLVLGLGLWNNPQVAYLALPALVWLAIRRRDLWKKAWIAAPGFLLGAAPWLALNLRQGFPSLQESYGGPASGYVDRLRGFFTHILPMTMGLRQSYSQAWLLGAVGRVLYVTALAVFIWLLVRRRTFPGLLVSVVLGYPLLFAIPKSSSYVAEPRYGLVLAPVVMLLLAIIAARRPGCQMRQLVMVGLAVVMSVSGVKGMVDLARRTQDAYDLNPPPLAELISTLERQGTTTAFADYWISYRLTFETRERVVASPIHFVRYPPYHRKVSRSEARTVLLFSDSPADKALMAGLAQRQLPYQRQVVRSYAIYTFDQPADPMRELLPGA